MPFFTPRLDAADPGVVTSDVSEITASSALCGGTVTSDGGSPVVVRGVCWSTLPNPTIADAKSNDGTGTGEYISSITALSPGTIYYVRAYATNSENTSYGDQKAFTTLTDLPAVTTAAVTDIAGTTAVSGGNVTSGGGTPVTARGVCWGTLPNPVLGSNFTLDGEGVGEFASSISGLTPGTTYHVRAYATNIVGTVYGEDLSFTTITLPSVTTAAVSDIADTTAACGGEVTADGGTAVSVRGVCWSTSENPTTDDSTTEDGGGLGAFTSSITGLSPGTIYFVRAYATNPVGTSYGEQRYFKTSQSLVTLTMAVAGSGTTNPQVGEHSVASLEPVPIVAAAADRYHFVNWTSSGQVQISDPNSPSTTVILSGNATVTANFVHDTASLSLTVIPSGLGTTTPEPGIHVVDTFESVNISASPSGGNYFTGWIATGNATVANASAAETTVTLSGDAILAANFSPIPPDKAIMTMAVSPGGMGIAAPEGTSVVSIKVPQTIIATPSEGNYFAGWTAFPSINASFNNSNSATTTITLLGDTNVTANFSSSPPATALLTMQAAPEGSGTTTPEGTIEIFTGIPFSITAIPSEGYYFSRWSATEAAKIAMPYAPDTNVAISADATVTAEFSSSKTLFFAIGSAVTVLASDLGDPLLLEFNKTPKITTAKPSEKALRMKAVNSASANKPSKYIRAEWVKKVLLYDKKQYRGVKISETLLKNPMGNLPLGNLFAQTKEAYNNVPFDLGQQPWLAVPVITDISNSGGVIVLRGYYFGSKAPKILIEYTKTDGKWRYKPCTVDKTATYKFKNSKGMANSSCMKVLADDLGGQPLGYSEVMVEYPTLPPEATLSGYLILDNSISMTTVKIP